MPNKNEKNESGSIDQVRDLLFGAQMKDFENLLKRQEDAFNRELSNIKNDLKSRFETLEKFMQSESKSLLLKIEEDSKFLSSTLKDEQIKRQSEIENEHRERLDGLSRLAKDMSVAESRLEEKITSLTDKMNESEQAIRKLMLTETGSLNEMLEAKYQEALAALRETAAQIRSDMVYKTTLSSLFVETAMKVTEETKIEKEKKIGKQNA